MRASHLAETLALRALAAPLHLLPLPLARRAGGALGGLAHALGIRRGVCEAQLRAAFPEWDDQEIHRVARASYEGLGTTLVELLRLRSLPDEEVRGMLRGEGREHLDRGLARGRGVIVVAFHYGNWELGGAYATALGYPLDVIVARLSNPAADLLVNRIRSSRGMGVIYRRHAVAGALRALRANRCVAFLCDQDAGSEGVFVPFFGRKASAPRGPAVLALRTGAPSVTVLTLRDGGGYRFIVEPLEVPLTGDREADIFAYTAAYTARLEAYIRWNPGQWLWQHRRWKSAPA